MKLTKILKQLMVESPDGIHMKDYDLKWYDPHTISCIYDPHTKISFFSFDSGRIHNEIRNSIVAMYKMGEENKLNISPDGVWNDEVPSEHTDNQIMIQMIHANYSGKHLIKYFIENTEIDEYRLVNRGRDLVKRGYIFYRAWTLGDDKIISFWNEKSEVVDDYDNILNHIYKFKNVLPEEFKAEFADNFGEFVKHPSDKSSDNTTTSYKELLSNLFKRQHIDPKAKEELLKRGLIGAGKTKEEPEWNKPFKESMKLTKILDELLVETKETYEVENVFINGKRVGGITMASSDKQALSNIIIRNLPENLRGTIGIKIADAKKIGGYKIKKLSVNPSQSATNRLPYRDD